MSASTNIKTGDVINFTIKVNGKSIPDKIEVFAIETTSAVNKIPSASVTLLDGHASLGEFKASSSATFVPGNEIVIEAGYDQTTEVIFKGIITKQSIKIDRDLGSVLEVICRDKAVKMAVGRKSKTFTDQKDSEIIQSIISNYSGLSSDVSSTKTTWSNQVQYYVSDWDFIMSRAEVNGMIITPLNGIVSIFPPNKDTSSVFEVTYGDNLLAFDADLNSLNQYASARADSWDFETQKIASGSASSSYAGSGNLSTNTLSKVVGLKEYDLQTTAPLESTDLTQWSKAEIVKSEYAKIQGQVTFQGNSSIVPGKYITLSGLGDRFNGDHLVSEVVHEIAHGNWTTEASLGLSSTWFTQEPEVMAPPASGLLPGVQGLYNGTVKKIYEDPENQYRILVDVPLFDAKGDGIWARLSNFYSTSGAGAFFLPEEGDEVVLGFLNQDPRYPIILGSMYSSSQNKPYESLNPAEKNPKKAIVSKSGIYIEFDDEKKVFTVQTPNQNQLVFSDENKSITIKDENGNSILMSESGIEVRSDKNITIQASQNLTLKGDTGVNIESSIGNVSIKGMNIKNDANMEFSAQGNVSAKLIGEAQTTIKGAMVMIN